MKCDCIVFNLKEYPINSFFKNFFSFIFQEENNNDIVADVSSTTTVTNKNILTPQQALNELRQRNAKFNIAAANPLLAGNYKKFF